VAFTLLELEILVCKLFALVSISATVSSITLTVLVVKRHLALLKHLRTGLRLKEGKAHKGGF